MLTQSFIDSDREAAGWHLVAMYRRALLKYAIKLARDYELAEDWVNTAILKTPAIANKYDPNKEIPFAPYMLHFLQFEIRHARQTYLRNQKKRKVESLKEISNITPLDLCIIERDSARILEILRQADPDLELIVKEYFINDLPKKRIAEKYRINQATVSNLLNKAIRIARANV